MDAKRQRALTNAIVAGVITAVVGLIVISLLPERAATPPVASPTTSPSPVVVCEPSWEPVPSPDPEDGGSLLLGVAVVAPDDAWAVGGAGDPVQPTSTLTIRWNGAEWDVVASPNVGAVSNRFDAVDALSPDAAWAVGRASDGAGEVPIAAQWDGGAWSLLPMPPDVPEGALLGVAAVSTDDVWAVGYSGDAALEEERALALHWNGFEWEPAPVRPAIGGGRSALVAIAGSSGSDLWAVGYQRNRPAILHYDGGAWARSTSEVAGDVSAVTVLAPDDVWAVGERTQHFDGGGWTDTGPTRASGTLAGVAAVGPEDVWAVGSRLAGEPPLLKPLVQRWDGARWARLEAGGVGGAVTLTGVSALPDGTLLGVGYRDFREGRSTFTLRGATCADA